MSEDRPTNSPSYLTGETDGSIESPLCITRLAHPQANQETTFAIVADPHVTPSTRGTWKVYHRTEERLQAAITDINRRDIETVVSVGDLTKDGTPSEFHRVDELLDDLQPPFVAIPVNHDVPKPSLETHSTPPIESFVRRYTEGQLPFVKRIGGVDLVGLNSATAADGSLDDTHGGHVSESQLTWLADVLPSLKCPVVAVHHNLTRHVDGDAPTSTDIWQLNNAREVATVLENCGVSLVLAGHTHCSTVGTLAGVREVVIPATCSFPQVYGSSSERQNLCMRSKPNRSSHFLCACDRWRNCSNWSHHAKR